MRFFGVFLCAMLRLPADST